ncbi:centriolar and ciliogenesis-associated protein HYLS1 isoform X1 [Anas platyrhynchos]|uniref:HYLS1 centriolar and ciliosis associated n=3 Tax=Anas platyrhynchos TaxID=8839 RepID=A0A8B9QZH0_ANAPL|nr:hydrolethalus syndrome protein 1 isoform X1 [Anas platyrhynchos]|eukprot:XP_027300086.1 hydrolethalus syndrome protein 1 isoform X1 [Anas platyrhynchos]
MQHLSFDCVAGPELLQDPASPAETMENTQGAERYGWATLSYEEQQGSSESWRVPPRCDPYTVATGLKPALPAFAEPIAAPWSPGNSRRLAMKRKVLRRRPDGGVEVSDESVISTWDTSDEVWSLRQKMCQLSTGPEDSLSEGEIETSSSSLEESSLEPYCHRQTPGDGPPFLLRVLQDSPTSQYTATAGPPKSFIPPRLEALGRNRGKTDRVAKYFEYKREWERFHVPGEDQRKDLRWGIREQMLDRPGLPSRPQRTYVPNAYTVPTDKKRAALRWEVRWDLANGLIPRKNTFF